MTNNEYTREDFDEYCPRFIPLQYDGSISYYIFDTEKLDFIDDIVPYHEYKEAEKVCNLLNAFCYILKGGIL